MPLLNPPLFTTPSPCLASSKKSPCREAYTSMARSLVAVVTPLLLGWAGSPLLAGSPAKPTGSTGQALP